MKLQEIARRMGIRSGEMNKTDLIRTIQMVEGIADCYTARQRHECDQINCLWREDCMRAISKR